ncbi:MAG: CapA family protein, partial [Proteobacteria bacterium]|nr:CapA family protein [Pseudomonadota bacterium]
ATGCLRHLAMTPTQIRHFRVNRAPDEGERWFYDTLNREGEKLGTRVERGTNRSFELRWNS